MERQNNRNPRERRGEDQRRESGNHGRFGRNDRGSRYSNDRREDISHISGLNRYRLNDLYERSSI